MEVKFSKFKTFNQTQIDKIGHYKPACIDTNLNRYQETLNSKSMYVSVWGAALKQHPFQELSYLVH